MIKEFVVRGLKMPLMVAAVAVLGLAGCGEGDRPAAQETRTVTHASGTSAVPLSPRKVVVFDTAALDTMDALGIPVAGVPRNNVTFPPLLAKYQGQGHLNAGGLFEPDFQALGAAAPDLIVGGGRAKKAYDELNRIAPTIDLEVDNSRFMESFRQRTLQLGEIFGKEAEAKAILDELDRQAAAVRAKAQGAGTGLVVLISGGRLSAYGPGSRFGFIYDGLGFEPPLELPDKGQRNAMSFELLLQADPDWLFVISRDAAIGTQGAASAEQVLDNELVAKTKAKRLGHIVYLDSAEMYMAGGIQTLTRLTRTVDQALSARP
jgi:ABC-type enterochelin transport system, periplasmic component